MRSWFLLGVMAALGLLLTMDAALALDGQPADWQMNFQPAVTSIARLIAWFHSLMLYITTAITLFVLALLLYVVFRFSEKRNPEPSKTSHNTLIEVVWTVLPVVILIIIAVPSFRLLYAQYTFPPSDLTIKAVGNQWYWSYEYPDVKGVSFDSLMLTDDERKKGQPRLLATDNNVVVPVNKVVHVLITASDVIHNWTVPAFGSKVDAVPGRLTKTWFKAEKTGMFYGQCSELCGKLHAFMPIAVQVVSEPTFERWLAAIAEDEDKAKKILEEAAREDRDAKKVAAR